MSKPGGKTIVKKRPFFRDQFFAVYVKEFEGQITGFEFHNFVSGEVYISNVNELKILDAWKKLEEYANQITHGLLIKLGAKIKGPTQAMKKQPRKNH